MKVLFLQFMSGMVQEPVRELEVTAEEGGDVTYGKVLEVAGTPYDAETMDRVTYASPGGTDLCGFVEPDDVVEEGEIVGVFYKNLFVLDPKKEATAADPDKDRKE